MSTHRAAGRRARAEGAPLPGSAEEAILYLIFVLRGDGQTDHGLMSHMVNGEQHIERCQRGMWITPGLRGDPCSKRCLQVQDALDMATRWLWASRGQPALWDSAS